MDNFKLLGQKWQKIDLISIVLIFAAFLIMDFIGAIISGFVFNIDSQQLASYTVSWSKYVIPTIVFAGIMCLVVLVLGMPNRNLKKDCYSILAIIFIRWLVTGLYMYLDPIRYSANVGVRETLFMVVRVFGSIWLSWLFSLLLLLVVGLGAYAGLSWKRRRILKGKVVPHYWWDDDDLPCLLTDNGCYFWDREEKRYDFAMYEDVASDEK